MNEAQIQDDRPFANEARIDRIAGDVAREHGLVDRLWDCGDERHDVLADVIRDTSRRYCLDECQEAYLRDSLNDIAAPAADETEQVSRDVAA